MEQFDETLTSGVGVVAELSRPRRQYKEDRQTKRKPQGRKREKHQHGAKRVNWQTPFLWSQIETCRQAMETTRNIARRAEDGSYPFFTAHRARYRSLD